jgi:hypothetical protein
MAEKFTEREIELANRIHELELELQDSTAVLKQVQSLSAKRLALAQRLEAELNQMKQAGEGQKEAPKKKKERK